MSDDVTITFRSRIEVGESMFLVPVRKKFVNPPHRLFGFESITLMPEYQNTQAFAYKLDPKSELETPVKYPIQLEINYNANYYNKEDGLAKINWSYLTSQTDIGTILASINQYFDKNKPPGTYLPPVFFDWLHLESLDEDQTIRGYCEENAEIIYGEAFDPAKHAIWLPTSLAQFDNNFNNCIYPTLQNEMFLEDVRLRMWVAPNTTITFSNQSLPLALGFIPSQIPPKNKKGQIQYVNTDVTDYVMYPPYDSPTLDLPVADLRGSKMHCYTTANTVVSPPGYLETVKEREKNPELLHTDYANSIAEIGKMMNVYLSLEFDIAREKRFSFKYPNNANISIRINVPSSVMRQLGFDPADGEWISQKAVAKPISTSVDTEDLEKKALALVYDSGMLAVDLYQQNSQLSSHSGNTLMATLHPKKDGTLRNRIYYDQVPRVQVSSNNPDLKFAIYRFDDDNIKHPLGWPVGAYVFGTLTGKV